ncbi:MAG: cytosolic protein, partial [Anaerolineae bacterium]
GHVFLDKELQQVTPEAVLGRRRVDKLVQVWRKGGDEAWVLVHVEVQSQEEAGFAERMYVYNYRLFDRYHRRVASLAVLGDERPGWRPERFGYELWGCQVGLTFPTVKLLDYRAEWSALEDDSNPFAIVVMAHLKTQETRGDDEGRRAWKWTLTRRLYERGYEREDVVNLFRFIDWVMRLPEGLEEGFWREMREYEEVRRMPYITSVERIGIKKGIEQGIQQGIQQGRQQGIQQGIREGLLAGIELGLELKFGSQGLRLLPEVYKIEDVDVLRAIHEGLKTVTTVEGLRRVYAASEG